MERQGAAASVDVDVPGDAPADHLQVVDADALLEEVVSLLIVDHQDVLTAGDLEATVMSMLLKTAFKNRTIAAIPNLYIFPVL